MDLQQMRHVVAVAETRNFTRAAKRCFVVQSSLSHRIAGLERELGVKLFARSSGRVELTPAGAAFVAGARECLAAADRAAADAAAATGVVRGRLAVGVIVTTAAVDVPELLQRYRARHPDVRVALRSGRSDELAAAVRDGWRRSFSVTTSMCWWWRPLTGWRALPGSRCGRSPRRRSWTSWAGRPPGPNPIRRSRPRAWCAMSRTRPVSWS
ncbi:hypothetical protein GCM10010276_45580 [Streptomyces longisporus]|uniref:HTH lysR-type domain-containing protein n=1 Tax=Streptomyces longisporus TaxID=1948 RepID=A0ABP5ZIR5_STRLO